MLRPEALDRERHPQIYFKSGHFEPTDAAHAKVTRGALSVSSALTFLALLFCVIPVGVCQVSEPPQMMHPGEHSQDVHHHLHMPLGEEKCEPEYIYTDGPFGPRQWPGLCNAGRMQAPIDITHAEKLHIDKLQIGYQPADLDIINDCNHYQLLVKFPDNYWLKVGKKPYNLAEIHFREPGENAVQGKRPRMSIQFVHFSPEGVFLVIEVPVVAGKENWVFKTLWEHIPAPGKENKAKGLQINAADLLPADRSFYRFPGSLTTPPCPEVVTWVVMKNPIEFSEAQIAEYTKHYPSTARPLQPPNNRPVVENQ
jgi:carbonic anhydrase